LAAGLGRERIPFRVRDDVSWWAFRALGALQRPHRRVCDFVGPSGSVQRCEGSLAVHLRGPPCSWVRLDSLRGLAGVATCARSSSTGPEASRTSPLGVSCGKFPSQRDVAHGLPFAFPTSIHSSACAAVWTLSFSPVHRCGRAVHSPGVVQRSPLHRYPLPSRLPAPVCRVPKYKVSRGVRSGSALALSRDPLTFRPRRFYGLAGFFLARLPGCCTRPRSWGSARFATLRLSPPPRSPRRAPALRSLAPR